MPENLKGLVRIRASGLGELFDCAARWEAKVIHGKRMPSGPGAVIGTAVHAGAGVFDKAKLDGNPLRVDEAAGAVVDRIRQPEDGDGNRDEVVWDDSSPQKAESIALSLHAKYCTQIAPRNDYTAVEIKAEPLVFHDLGLYVTGTPDRIRHATSLLTGDEGHGISDLKTGKSVVGPDGTIDAGQHKLQIGIYEMLAEQATGIAITGPGQIIGMNSAVKSENQRVGVADVSGGRVLLLGDGETPGALELASDMIRAGRFPGNPRSYLCGVKYCPVYGECKWRR